VTKPIAVVVACAAVVAGLGAAVQAAAGSPVAYAVAAAPSPDRTDDAIKGAFKDVLDRQPTSSELRRYRTLMDEDGWTESDVRRDLRSRSDDRRPSAAGGDAERVIRRAYQDILNREPDPEGMRSYRRAMIDDGWTEREVRDNLRESPEYAKLQRESAERIVRRAYKEVLGRDPDSAGLSSYTTRVLRDGWDVADVRAALEKSPEYRQGARDRAERVVRDAYRKVLKRDPDDGGMKVYVSHVMRDKWTQTEVEQDLRRSDEYRKMQRK
jgi:hypothetical protein